MKHWTSNKNEQTTTISNITDESHEYVYKKKPDTQKSIYIII